MDGLNEVTQEKRRRRLARLKSGHDGTGGWQARKSEIARIDILDAAIDCFIRLGYARTTTSEIARVAGLSRGAMVHHFQSKRELVKAAIEHLNTKRLEDFRQRISSIPAGVDHTDAGIEAYWQHLVSPDFVAFRELLAAARTDPELEAMLLPAVNAMEREWYEVARAVFPEWNKAGVDFDTAMNLTQFLMEGMAIHVWLDEDHPRYRRTRDYLKARLRDMLGVPGGAARQTPELAG